MISPKRSFYLFVIFGLGVFMTLTEFVPQEADTLFVNGIIYTLDAKGTKAEAIAVRDGDVVAVGTREHIEHRFIAHQVVDLQGSVVFPGFIDSHAHLMALGLAKLTVDLVGTKSEKDACDRVALNVAGTTSGQWVRGRGWDQNDWAVKRFPTRESLDHLSKEQPIVLSRVDGHAMWVNTKALELAGITAATPDPEGGKIIRDARGVPTGVLVDNAMVFVQRIIPPPTHEEASSALTLAFEECASAGLTGIHDMGIDTFEVDLYKRMIGEGKFPLRVYAAIDGPNAAWNMMRDTGPLVGYGNDHLTIRALKMYVDGALGSRGAALIDPYSDDPENRGLTLTDANQLQMLVADAIHAGFQVCTHAIGDRANHLILDVYENALKKTPDSDLRLRIEHAQVLAAEDIPRFSQLGVLPCMQPTHCTSDMYWAEARLGSDRVLGAYAWRSLLMTGAIIPGGSDFPIESPNPLLGIYAASTRQNVEGIPQNVDDVRKMFQLSASGIADSTAFDGGWYATQRMSREEAIRSFTSWSAFAAFEEKRKGTLERGKHADFVVLSADVMTIPAREIPSVKVKETFVGGKSVYRAVP